MIVYKRFTFTNIIHAEHNQNRKLQIYDCIKGEKSSIDRNRQHYLRDVSI